MNRNDRASPVALAVEECETRWNTGPAVLFIVLSSLALWWVLIRINIIIFF